MGEFTAIGNVSQPRPARAMIGNLLLGTGTTLETARELAKISGESGLAERIEGLRQYLSNIAFEVVRIPARRLDEEVLGVALDHGIGLGAVSGGQMSAALRAYLLRLIRERLTGASATEAELLVCLLENVGAVVPKPMLKIVTKSKSSDDRVVKVLICRLRNRLDLVGLGQTIETSRNGYLIAPVSAQQLLDVLNA
jgi:hypothetical protein